MREAARATAARHDDRRIVAEWGRVQREAAARHDRPALPLEGSLDRLRVRFLRGRLRVSASLAGLPRGAEVVFTLRRRGRGPLVRGRRPARDGRIVWFLDERASRFVDGRHPLTCIVEAEFGGSRVHLETVTVHPDTRSLPRRTQQRVLQRFAGG
jgi:hypothetical protein